MLNLQVALFYKVLEIRCLVFINVCLNNLLAHPDIQKLEKMFKNIIDIKERNKQILKAYEQGYSQHRIAKVLDISQPTVNGTVKRNRK